MVQHSLTALAALAAFVGASGVAGAEYPDAERLATSLRKLADGSPAAALETFGTSRQGRPLWALTLAAPDPARPVKERTALLLTAGIDGDRPAGSSVALKVAEKLLAAYADGDASARKLLTEHAVHVLPRVNPDAVERYFGRPRVDARYSVRPVDDDRDGAFDEDGPDDLNGDGLITMMRVRDPQATHLADPDHPRLVRKADRAKNERPVYKLYVEGIDDDGDGEYNEDPPGGVDLNVNFPHGYREHDPHAGPYQLSEPESRALIDFVLDHPRIAIAVTYGRHNNLLEIDESGKKDYTDKAPVELLEDDAPIYKHIGERFKELTGIAKAPKPESNGAFYAWLYAQFGIPSFATSVWQRPEPEKDDEGENGEGDAGDADGSGADAGAADSGTTHRKADDAGAAETPGRKPAQKGGKRSRMGKHGGRGKGKGDKKDEAEDMAENVAWLTYSDEQRSGDGFVSWTPFDHPTLGEVEIGGFKPYFKTTPPAEEIDALVDAQLKFLLDLGGRFPVVVLDHVEVIERSANVFEIKALLRNEGYFPTGLSVARQNRRVRPVVVRLDVGRDALLGGERVHRVWNVDGGGGAYELRWVVRGRGGTSVTVRVTSVKYGDRKITIPLVATFGEANGGKQS